MVSFPLYSLTYITGIHIKNLFSPSDIRVPASLSYHIADIYVEELDKALGSVPSPSPAPLSNILNPFFILASRTPTATTYKRIQSALLDPLLSALAPESGSEDERPKSKRIRLSEEAVFANIRANACYSDPETEGQLDGAVLKKKLLRRIFEIASQEDTRDSNRRKMYTLWKKSYDEDPDEDSE